MALDLGALGTCAACQGLGEVRRLDVAVFWMADGAEQPVGGRQRPYLAHLLRRQKLHLNADGAGHASVLAVFVHPIRRRGEADVADRAQPHVLPGLGFQGAVQVHRVLVQLPDGVAHVEQRQQTGGVPRRAGGEFLALQQQHVGPALARQVVERGNADHAAADHYGASGARHAGHRRLRTARPLRRRHRRRCRAPPDDAAVPAWSSRRR